MEMLRNSAATTNFIKLNIKNRFRTAREGSAARVRHHLDNIRAALCVIPEGALAIDDRIGGLFGSYASRSLSRFWL